MTIKNKVQMTPLAPNSNPSPKSIPTPKSEARIVSQTSSSHPGHDEASPSKKKPPNPKDYILSVASKISKQPLPNSDPDAWGVLTAICNNARMRQQGMNMILTAEEHCIGRLVEDKSFQIESTAVSGCHCKIYRKLVPTEGMEHPFNLHKSVFVKDTSTNGTYLNWVKLKKNTPEAKVNHGDIISFAAAPHHELAFAFVYREARKSNFLTDGAVKRKAEELGSESKRLKGIGIGAPEGPISLDDFRRLQRSNTELRKQLEDQVLAIEKLCNENREAVERHANEMKEQEESVTKSYTGQIKELRDSLEVKQKELVDLNKISTERKCSIEDLKKRLSALEQSCAEANDMVTSQTEDISSLKKQLLDERDQRKKERETAQADLKAAIEKIQLEAQEELKRQSFAALIRERELQEEINKLQEHEKEISLQSENWRSKLEDARNTLVNTEEKVRKLETELSVVRSESQLGREKVKELENDTQRLRDDLEKEKAAKEEALAKVSELELEVAATMRDLEHERRKLHAREERIMLRETQLRAFYSTSEKISVLCAMQQEQLKAMMKTLEDEENYENTSLDLNRVDENENLDVTRDKQATGYHQTNDKAGSINQGEETCSEEEVSATEKHDCDIQTQEENVQNTEEVEFTSTERFVKGAFGSDIEGGTTLNNDTECVLETESPGIDLNKCSGIGDTLQLDTMQLDDETPHAQEVGEPEHDNNSPHEVQKVIDDSEPRATTVQTADLLASEVLGSLAFNTPPSVHGENESQRSKDGADALLSLHDSNGGLVAESQSSPSPELVAMKRIHERRVLGEMIGIVAPDLKTQFGEKEVKGCAGDSDTEEGERGTDCEDNDNEVRGESVSDTETEGSDEDGKDVKVNDPMEEDDDDEATQEDSLG